MALPVSHVLQGSTVHRPSLLLRSALLALTSPPLVKPAAWHVLLDSLALTAQPHQSTALPAFLVLLVKKLARYFKNCQTS